MTDRLSTIELHHRFVAAVGTKALIAEHTGPTGELVVELHPPLPNRVRVYIFNATNPPGGRSTPEHKIQLTGQGRDERGDLNWSGADLVLLCGYVPQHDVFVFWDAAMHVDFAYSKNLQVKTANIETAAASRQRVRQNRQLRTGMEVVICAPSHLVIETIFERSASGVVTAGTPSRVLSGRAYIRPPYGGIGTEKSRVFRFDPDAIDRGTRAHKNIQNRLADAVRARGWEPLSPSDCDPLFDVAWVTADVAWIAEVKSLTHANEERQLRLGLGQVLSYAHLVNWGYDTNYPVLAVEREPSSGYWLELCRSHGVALSWPDVFDELLDSCR